MNPSLMLFCACVLRNSPFCYEAFLVKVQSYFSNPFYNTHTLLSAYTKLQVNLLINKTMSIIIQIIIVIILEIMLMSENLMTKLKRSSSCKTYKVSKVRSICFYNIITGFVYFIPIVVS